MALEHPPLAFADLRPDLLQRDLARLPLMYPQRRQPLCRRFTKGEQRLRVYIARQRQGQHGGDGSRGQEPRRNVLRMPNVDRDVAEEHLGLAGVWPGAAHDPVLLDLRAEPPEQGLVLLLGGDCPSHAR